MLLRDQLVKCEECDFFGGKVGDCSSQVIAIHLKMTAHPTRIRRCLGYRPNQSTWLKHKKGDDTKSLSSHIE